MSNYFEDIYTKRLNRYGLDYKQRVQNQRIKEFDDLLLRSAHRLDFTWNGETYPGILNAKKQDETQTLQNLLTRRDLVLPNGTILKLNDQIQMIYWLEDTPDGGYNKYTTLKMTHYLKWVNKNKEECGTWAYLYGQEDNMLKDELKSRSRSHILYTENLKESFFVCPRNEQLFKGDYIEVGEGNLKEAYTVTGYDIQSTLGVEYVTVDPVYIRDTSESPLPIAGSSYDDPDYFWLQGE